MVHEPVDHRPAATALVAEDLAPPSLALLPPAQLALVGDLEPGPAEVEALTRRLTDAAVTNASAPASFLYVDHRAINTCSLSTRVGHRPESASAEGADRGRPSRAGQVADAGAWLGEGLEPIVKSQDVV